MSEGQGKGSKRGAMEEGAVGGKKRREGFMVQCDECADWIEVEDLRTDKNLTQEEWEEEPFSCWKCVRIGELKEELRIVSEERDRMRQENEELREETRILRERVHQLEGREEPQQTEDNGTDQGSDEEEEWLVLEETGMDVEEEEDIAVQEGLEDMRIEETPRKKKLVVVGDWNVWFS